MAKDHRLFAFYHLAAYTGARRGELLNLRCRDIDLASAQVHISGSTAVIGGRRIEGTTKSGRSRTISIDAGTIQVLREHRARQAEECLAAGPRWTGSDQYVFTTSWGSPIHPDTVSSLMTDLIKTYNAAVRRAALVNCYRTPGCMICGTFTRRPCCSPACPSMSSRPAWAMPIRRSRCGSTRT